VGQICVSRCRAWLEPSHDIGPHVRALLKNGALLRWCVVALVAVRVIVDPPQLYVLALPWLLWAASCNTALLWLGDRLGLPAATRLAQAVVLADAAALVALVQIFAGDLPGALYGGVTLVLLEAVICWGARGVLTASSLTLVALAALQDVHCSLLHVPMGWTAIVAQDVVIGVLSTALVMARRLLAHAHDLPHPSQAESPVSSHRLTSREQEVLALLAEGCSNTMIARRLHLTESTVKHHVEAILNRLNVRNRAEAVAVASRLGLLH
jgi:DNA-binding CsgD family transcriptional regulator